MNEILEKLRATLDGLNKANPEFAQLINQRLAIIAELAELMLTTSEPLTSEDHKIIYGLFNFDRSELPTNPNTQAVEAAAEKLLADLNAGLTKAQALLERLRQSRNP